MRQNHLDCVHIVSSMEQMDASRSLAWILPRSGRLPLGQSRCALRTERDTTALRSVAVGATVLSCSSVACPFCPSRSDFRGRNSGPSVERGQGSTAAMLPRRYLVLDRIFKERTAGAQRCAWLYTILMYTDMSSGVFEPGENKVGSRARQLLPRICLARP